MAERAKAQSARKRERYDFMIKSDIKVDYLVVIMTGVVASSF